MGDSHDGLSASKTMSEINLLFYTVSDLRCFASTMENGLIQMVVKTMGPSKFSLVGTESKEKGIHVLLS